MTDIQLRHLAHTIRDKFSTEKIILFGSHAYGEPKAGSDVDLLVIMRTSLPIREQAYLIRREIESSVPIDIIVRTPEQIEERIRLGDFLIKRIVEHGIEL